MQAVKSVAQYVEVLPHRQKPRRLLHIVGSFCKDQPCGKVLVFAATKRTVEDLVYEMRKAGFKCLAIHGDKEQQERDWVLHQFRAGTCSILVATDVASRGLDVSDIMLVINFDMPNQISDYVHRIGRTGRAGKIGTAYSFFTEDDASTGKFGSQVCCTEDPKALWP